MCKETVDKIHDLDQTLTLVRDELIRAWSKHPGQFNNAHEGYAVLKEEVDELWDEVKVDMAYTRGGMKEAIQTAAMAIRFVVELHDHSKSKPDTRIDLPAEAKAALQRMFPLQHPPRQREEATVG